MDNCIDLLCSHQKLDRDRGVEALEELLPSIANGDAIRQVGEQFLDLLSESETKSWETFQGGLLALKCLYEKGNHSNDDIRSSFEAVCNACLKLLKHDEARVRLAAGELLGALSSRLGLQVYIMCKEVVLYMIESNLERDFTADKGEEGRYEIRRSSSMEIFHDTAGWRSLETSMKCLQCMINGCGPQFQEMIDQDLLDLIFVALKHSNRFVRETGYYVFGSLVSCVSNAGQGFECHNKPEMLFQFGDQLSDHLALGLADNWSQVRLAASEATRKFLMSISETEERSKYLSRLLPCMCLNRYYVAEGVRLYSQESWKLITGTRGKELVEQFIDSVVTFYISQTEADNHAVREAACSCIAELGSKINSQVVQPYVQPLLEALVVCFQDDSWPVRDAACVACGNFILCFPQQSQPSMNQLYPLFFDNLQDNIASVRQGGAVALANVTRAYGQETLPMLKEKIVSALTGVKDQPTESYKENDSTENLSQFGVVKHLRDNDVALHTNQPMFSCGSLAPKMGRGGGCMDHKFRRPTEPWDRADGAINLVSELSSVDCARSMVGELLPELAESVSHKHYTQHVVLIETLCKQLVTIAKGLGKSAFKRHLECFLDVVFYGLQVDNALTSSAAHSCLCHLSTFLGPNILRGRIEYHNPSYLQLYDRTVF